MRLKVPLVKQGNGTSDCGPACIAMLMRYYKFDTSLDSINKDLGRNGLLGMSAYGVGNYLLNKSLDVCIVSFDANALVKDDSHRDAEEVITGINGIGWYQSADIMDMLKFSRRGGRIQFRIPTLEDIASEIAGRRPVMVTLTNNFISGKTPRFNLHFNLVTGIDGKFVYANDPMDARVRYDRNDFLFGMYAPSGRKSFCNIIKVRDDVLNYR